MTGINQDIMAAANQHVAEVQAVQLEAGLQMTKLHEANIINAFVTGAIWMGDRILNSPKPKGVHDAA